MFVVASVSSRLAAQRRRLGFRASAAAGLAPPQPAFVRATPLSAVVRVAFVQAASAPSRSEAALAAAHDAARAPHRPGGRATPRARWSLDEEPRGGWQPLV